MSCVSFTGDGHLARLRAADADLRSVSTFRSPAVTPGKVQRLRDLAASADPKIRESAALAYATPVEVLRALAVDDDLGVRFAVARNDHAPAEVLWLLAADASPGVRAWVAANPGATSELLDTLADDPDRTVRDLVTWALGWPRSCDSSAAVARPAPGRAHGS